LCDKIYLEAYTSILTCGQEALVWKFIKSFELFITEVSIILGRILW
jgi:hypothetical protein